MEVMDKVGGEAKVVKAKLSQLVSPVDKKHKRAASRRKTGF